ncbi:SsrA-binding protein SmpB [Lachnospiraceae bacterium YH-ros2228]|jgi:SsrA-binding protein|nr:SsrA-binding protein SmpB [Lachnospiraceae bacterium]MDD6450261.1 SsrA-binding protein SmpB [Lachnospiraceae bacterium]
MADKKKAQNLIANNPKARHDYFLDEYIECGIELVGTEVKSLRARKCSIKEAWVRIQNGEVYIYQMHISPYEKGNIFNRDPLRPRKLLLHKSEILKLTQKIKEKGYTLVPVEIYFKGSRVKVEIALARGKKLYDKRRDIAAKDQKREAERDFKVRNLK